MRRRDRTYLTRDVCLRRAEKRQVCVEEVISVSDRRDLIERRVACSDNCDCAFCDVCAIVGCQIACAAEWFESADDVGEGLGAVGFEVDEEVEGLAGGGVEDAVVGARGLECGCGVLALEDREDGLDVKTVEGAGLREGCLFVADVEGVVVEPDVSLD